VRRASFDQAGPLRCPEGCECGGGAGDGAENAGRVEFQGHDEHTHIHVELDVEPQGAAQETGDMLGMLEQQVRSDLVRFKELIESR
jgi:uncharacterized membrane protein